MSDLDDLFAAETARGDLDRHGMGTQAAPDFNEMYTMHTVSETEDRAHGTTAPVDIQVGSDLDEMYAAESEDRAHGTNAAADVQAATDLDEMYAAETEDRAHGSEDLLEHASQDLRLSKSRRLGSGKTGRVNKTGGGRPPATFGGSILRARRHEDESMDAADEAAAHASHPPPGSVEYARLQKSLKARGSGWNLFEVRKTLTPP